MKNERTTTTLATSWVITAPRTLDTTGGQCDGYLNNAPSILWALPFNPSSRPARPPWFLRFLMVCLYSEISIIASAAKSAATTSPATTTTTTTPTTIPTTTDGYHYEPATGLLAGPHTAAVVALPRSPGLASLPADYVFDVIVLSAGYAGQTAARDAAVSGLRP